MTANVCIYVIKYSANSIYKKNSVSNPLLTTASKAKGKSATIKDYHPLSYGSIVVFAITCTKFSL